jgi:hypothetical protein
MVHIQIGRRRRQRKKRKIPLWIIGIILLTLLTIATAQAMAYVYVLIGIAGLPLGYLAGRVHGRSETAKEIDRIRRLRATVDMDAVSEYPPELTGKIPANADYGKGERGVKAREQRDRILSDPRSGAKPLPQWVKRGSGDDASN